jgi:hypothetical protein
MTVPVILPRDSCAWSIEGADAASRMAEKAAARLIAFANLEFMFVPPEEG